MALWFRYLSGSTLATFVTLAVLAALAACGPATAPAPTPPPGLAVAPTAQVIDVSDRDARARWPLVSPRVHAMVLGSTAISLVVVVEYESSDRVFDTSKDNFR